MANSRGPELDAVLGVFLALSWLFTSLRVYVRLGISHNWGTDDTCLLATLASFTTFTISALLSVKYGSGKHPSAISPADIPYALKFYFLCEIFYTLTTVLLRLSISIFLLRICTTRVQKSIIWGTMFVVIAFSTFYFFLAIFQCSPVSYYWLKYAGMQGGTCIAENIFPDATYAHAAVSAAADFVLAFVPVLVMWKLDMDWRTKVSVGLVLGMGFVAGLAALIRIPFVRVLGITDEFLYATVDVAIWSTIEPALGIIAASACVLRPLFKKFYHLSTSGGNRHGHGGYNTQTSQSRGTPLPWNNHHGPRNRPIELAHSRSARIARNSLGGPLGSNAVKSVVENDPFEFGFAGYGVASPASSRGGGEAGNWRRGRDIEEKAGFDEESDESGSEEELRTQKREKSRGRESSDVEGGAPGGTGIEVYRTVEVRGYGKEMR